MTDTLVNYSIFSAADSEEMSRLLGEVFAEQDPPALAVGLTVVEFEAFVRLYGPKADAEGLSIVARSAATGKMVGALLAEDSATEPPAGHDQLSPKFAPIFDILGQLDAEYSGGRSKQLAESVHLFLLGVAPSHAGRGVAKRLVAECLANSISKRFSIALTEATNKKSQHLFRKQGFIDRVRRSYKDHRFEERAFFTSITEQEGPILMEKYLSP